MTGAQVAFVLTTQAALGFESASRSIETALAPFLAIENVRSPTINDSDPVIWWTIYLYRIVIAAFLGTLLYLIVQFLSLRLFEPKQLRILRKNLRKALRRDGNVS